MLRTRLTDALQVEHPVMLAGMGGVSYHRLVVAVSEAGGFGCLGASTMGDEEMRAEIASVRAATSKPFGVDLLTALPHGLESKVQDVVRGGATAFVAGLGATMALVPQVVDAVGERVPVVAAGGIVDGRGLAAALALGADGVWVGTRFIATPEARGVRGYKETLLRSHEDDTVVTKAYTGKTCRVIANSYTQEYEDGARAIQRFPAQVLQSIQDGANHLGGDEATAGVDADREFFPAGQGVGSIDALVPAGDLVREIVDEAEAVLAKIRP
jgi:enoyl-[acyl-carrier protein] reductase II